MFRVLLVLLLGPLPVLAQTDTLTIATFNCEFLNRPRVHVKFGLPMRTGSFSAAERTEWEAPGFRDARFAEATGAVASLLAPIDADVLALTEVGDDVDVAQLHDSLAARGQVYPHVFVGESADTFTGQHVALLSKHPIVQTLDALPGRERYLTEPDDADTEDDTGISKGLRASILAHGHTITFYVLHLVSEAGAFENDQKRVAQAGIARRHMLSALMADSLLVVAGDFNDGRGSPTLQRLRGLDDIFPDLIQTGLCVPRGECYFEDDEVGERWTYTFNGERQQIDHLLLSEAVDAATIRGGIQARTVAHTNALASDHRPLVVTLRLRGN